MSEKIQAHKTQANKAQANKAQANQTRPNREQTRPRWLGGLSVFLLGVFLLGLFLVGLLGACAVAPVGPAEGLGSNRAEVEARYWRMATGFATVERKRRAAADANLGFEPVWLQPADRLGDYVGVPLDAEPHNNRAVGGRVVVFGASVQGRPLVAYALGQGSIGVALVGGIHGGYEFNTIELMEIAIAYFVANPGAIPEQLRLYIIPALNPDGAALWLEDPTVQENPLVARDNARGVDLNRNFDCRWQPTSYHRERVISGGAAPFSEPESAAIRDFVAAREIRAILFYHSAGRWVEDGICADGDDSTQELGRAVARAMNFPFYGRGVPPLYPVSGDAPGYFNQIGVRSLGIELTTRTDPEWEIQQQGMAKALDWLAQHETQPQPQAGAAGE